ncbi:head GIN domain-containing protein [Paraflavitalea pollutisoli]|uniref:head GIN domain-containing protein n=1 Tax=Paraflavitalea pollutisoli TaxID=3034143 RepID=UPI0023EB7F2A|nr:head GIN domain-containing protein [Paraflavitalea sp. H1-2-19X]
MKKSMLMLGVLSMFVLTMSCKKKITGEGPTVTQTRTFSGFNKVALNVPANLLVTQEPGYKLQIDAQQNILDILHTSIKGDELTIYFDWDKRIGSHDKIVMRVSAPLYHGLSISGTGDISANSQIQTTGLKLSLSGSGSIMLADAVVDGTLESVISGSGNIQVNTGTANKGNFTISGSGNINMLGFTVKNADARISGSGNVKVGVTDALEAHISGSGSVYYNGNPAVNAQVSGSGKVRKAS